MNSPSFRIAGVALAVAGTTVLLATGCRKQTPAGERATTPPAPVYQEIARIFWQGTARIASDTNSAYLTNLLAVPETGELLAQTLDKLCRSPWRNLPETNRPPAERSSELLRPLVEDVLRQESCLRIRQASNSPPEAAFAIRLDAERQALWSTNLASVLQLISSNAPSSMGTNLAWEVAWGTNRVRFQPESEWAVLSFGSAASSAASDLLAEVRRGGLGHEAGSNYWAAVDIDTALLLPMLSVSSNLPGWLPRVSARLHGDGEYVRTRADVKFPNALPLKLEPWQIPTNFIREPLISFTALQGFQKYLEELEWVKKRAISPVPNQLFLWALNLTDVHTYGAAPMTNCAAEIDRLGKQLEGEWNSWITNHALGFADYSAPNHGIAWSALPMVAPSFQALPSAVGDVVFAKIAPALPPPGAHAPAELMSMVSSRTNTVLYDWEITEMRVKHWGFLGQSARLAFRLGQMPPGSKSLAFLQAVAPKLGNSVTEVTLLDPSTLHLTRKSHVGMTGVELHLLADWLESPAFPFGFNSKLAAPVPLFRWSAKKRTFEPTTNVAPVLQQP